MTDAAVPYLVVDSDRHAARILTPPYQAFNVWLKSEGVAPENAKHVEVYEGDPPYAVVLLYDVDERGYRILNEARDIYLTHTERVTLSSLPPLREV